MKPIAFQRGFTLSETVVALAVGMLILLAIYSAVNMAQRSTTGIERKVIAQQDVRTAIGIMALEIRMASYNSSLDSSIWVDPDTCTPGTPTARGIRNATASSITIEMDANDSGHIGDAENEIIAYRYLSGSADQRITRETIRCPPDPTSGSPQSFLGAAESEATSRTVHVINIIDGTQNVPVFRYFDGSGAELDPATNPIVVPDIRQITITLMVETADIDPGTNQKRKMIYGTTVTPKNHGITVNTATP